jgi:hypothetical protein
MRLLSAIEAIGPSIDRTKAVLFQPFRKGRSWKLAATAYLSAMGLVFIPYGLIFFAIPQPPLSHGNLPLIITAIFGVSMTVVMFLFFYLGSRLQFVLFAIVLEKAQMVAPQWRRFGDRTWGWLGLKVVLSLALCIIFGLPLIPLFRNLFSMMATIQPGQPPPPQVIFQILTLYAFIFIPVAFLMLCSSLLGDFVLPSIALENVSVKEACNRFLLLIKAEPGQLALFTLFKVLLAIAGAACMQVGIILAEIVSLIVFAIIGGIGWLILHLLGTVGHILMVAGGITLGLFFMIFLFYVMTFFMGAVHIFYQAYALYFLGGRYPLLGDLLEPTYTPPPLPNYPPSMPPA